MSISILDIQDKIQNIQYSNTGIEFDYCHETIHIIKDSEYQEITKEYLAIQYRKVLEPLYI